MPWNRSECVLDAAADRPIGLTVMDLCKTPLRQCAALLGDRAAGRIVTRCGSITGQAHTPPVDLIVAHSVLSFLRLEDLGKAAAFIHGSLRPAGHLVMTTALGNRAPASDPAVFRHHVLTQLAARFVPLPDAEPEFAALLAAYANARAERHSPFADLDALLRWLKLAGLTVETVQDLRRGTDFQSGAAPAARVSDGVLVVTERTAGHDP